MAYRDLRDFMAQLEATGDLRRVHEPVSPHLEMTALSDRVLRAGGPALLFEQPTGHHMPVLTNLFGTTGRVARAMGVMGLPVTVILNPAGEEVGRLIGDAHWDAPEAQAVLKALMTGG